MTIRLATLIRFDTLHVMVASAFAEVVFGAAVEPEPDFEPDPDVEPDPVPTVSLLSCSIVGVFAPKRNWL